MARRWCKIPKTFLCEAPDFDKGQDCWPPCDSVFIPMCNKRYISKPKNKEIGSVSGKTDSPMLLFSCFRFSGWIPIWSMDAIPRNPSYSASFSPLIFLLHLSISNLSISVIKYVFFQRRRLRPHLRITLDPPGLDPGRVLYAELVPTCSQTPVTRSMPHIPALSFTCPSW